MRPLTHFQGDDSVPELRGLDFFIALRKYTCIFSGSVTSNCLSQCTREEGTVILDDATPSMVITESMIIDPLYA
jgi:hypothetical protein